MKSIILISVIALMGCASKKSDITVEMYGAAWCQPCNVLHPVVEQYCAKFDVDFRYLDLEKDGNREKYKESYLIPFIPILHIEYKGRLYYHGNTDAMGFKMLMYVLEGERRKTDE